ncbi:MAG: MutS-related protein, partial [Vicinamibacterales bacterium]
MNARRATSDALSESDARFAYARLATFAVAVLFGILVWRTGLSAVSLVVPAAAFAWLAHRHDRVLRARDAAQRGLAFYERGLARLEDRWPGTGEPGDRFRDDHHIYANDLDLFGRGSLFELLSLARTRDGEAMLAGWLTAPAAASEIRARQEAVDELAPALDLREQLEIAGTGVRESVRTDRLLVWAETPLPPVRALVIATWAATLAVIAATIYVASTSMWWPVAGVVVLEAAVFRSLRARINTIVSVRDPEATADFVADPLTHRVKELDVLAAILHRLEGERFQCGKLQGLSSSLGIDRMPASVAIRSLHRLAETYDAAKHALLVVLAIFLAGQLELALGLSALLQLVRPAAAIAVHRWRTGHGPQVRRWIATIAEFEALTSLGAYRYEHFEDPFPEIASDNAAGNPAAIFRGLQLGHPLIPASRMVRNDVRLDEGLQLLVVSGSNMSGKSTLLRTVGHTAVLALAGAPVRSRSLRISPLAIGATLRIQDSLLEGRSRFYAEITRIRELADLAAGPVPLLFLLDELFHGTNSHDRLTGAAGVLGSLLERGAIGLITTHDLALTAVAEELAPRAANAHFEDWFEGSDIRFDYVMKPGPVTRSNALALMR